MHLPTKRIHIHNSDKPWITPYIKNLISERQTAFAQSDSIKWRKLRNKVKREIELAKVKYNAERVRVLQKTEPHKWHQRIKGMLNSTVSDLHMNIPGIVPLSMIPNLLGFVRKMQKKKKKKKHLPVYSQLILPTRTWSFCHHSPSHIKRNSPHHLPLDLYV